MTKDNLATALALITVEIDGSGIEQGRTFKDKDTGMTKPLPGRQNAFLWSGAKYPITIQVDIPDGRPPYRPGTYLMAGAIFESGKFGRLEFKGGRNLELVPLAEAIEALSVVAAEEAPAKPVKVA